MATLTTTITEFQKGGISPDPRAGHTAISHFNTKYGSRLEHSRDFVVDTHPTRTITDMKIKKYVKAGGTIYGLGLGTGGASHVYDWDFNNYRWTDHFDFTATNLASTALIVYKDNFFGLRNGSQFWTNTLAGGSYNGSFKSITYSTVADPILHPLDDSVYWFYDNKVAKQVGTSAGDITLDYLASIGNGLPDDFQITTAVPYGEYVAIGGYNTDTNRSSVILWDRDSTIENSILIDLGEEQLQLLSVLEGQLIGVSLDVKTANVQTSTDTLLVIKALSGNTAITLAQYSGESIAVGGKFDYDDKMYFALNGFTTATRVPYIASVDSRGRLVLEHKIHDVSAGNQTAPSGLFLERGGVWAGFDTTGASYHTTSQETDVASYVTQIIESAKGDENLDFIGAVVRTEAIPASGSVSLYIRADASTESHWTDTTSWTLLRTFSTAGAVKHTVTKRGSATPPSKASRYQFKIDSVKADITGFFQASAITKDEAFNV